MKFFKIAMAVGLLFAVNMNADAQFGKLKGLANKAKEAVTGEGTTTTTDPVTDVTNSVSGESSNSGSSWTSPEVKENNGAKAAGGLDKYLGMTDADDQLVYSYYQPGSSDFQPMRFAVPSPRGRWSQGCRRKRCRRSSAMRTSASR